MLTAASPRGFSGREAPTTVSEDHARGGRRPGPAWCASEAGAASRCPAAAPSGRGLINLHHPWGWKSRGDSFDWTKGYVEGEASHLTGRPHRGSTYQTVTRHKRT